MLSKPPRHSTARASGVFVSANYNVFFVSVPLNSFHSGCDRNLAAVLELVVIFFVHNCLFGVFWWILVDFLFEFADFLFAFSLENRTFRKRFGRTRLFSAASTAYCDHWSCIFLLV